MEMILGAKDIGFNTWAQCNDQFGKYHFNEYKIDLTEAINLSPELLEGIIFARTTLNDVKLLNDKDVFGE
jgi:hypothetical protein